MGELVLISGPNGSGKSRFAERYIDARAAGRRYYIATMVPETEDNARRIEKHRAQRAGFRFETLELPRSVGAAPVDAAGAVLLEDVSNLLANAMFDGGGTAEDVFSDIRALRGRCALLVAVTISGLSPEDYADEGTAAYIRALNELNGRLLDVSGAAAEMEDGAPRAVKGDWNGIL